MRWLVGGREGWRISGGGGLRVEAGRGALRSGGLAVVRITRETARGGPAGWRLVLAGTPL
ncbi:hypothetical protein A8709_01825 [Paenibacillus pectinilyticus]|uniref:Uncharacterized protein n=1 Tax=Paenibacillus pectinilyticus TaxID=512399 RepID=A0A1C1A6L2_9BACL|nr:hypothetical protein [Paenibacillus pectinilyticus]OCT16205.1 hypothetical protein A8709_01825 [Paenibacillus pectinilyticus]